MTSYLRWAKLHPRVRYELTGSGVPTAAPGDFDANGVPARLETRGGYGDRELISALSERYDVPEGGIVPTPGTSSANFIALAVAAGHGEPVILEHPLYDPIERAAAFLGRRVIRLDRPPDRGFDVSLEAVEAGLRQGARAVFLTNLHNPGGYLLSPESIRRIAAACAATGATLIVDEVYLDAAHLNAGRPRWTAACFADNLIVTSSLTKVYGLGGLRVGWLMACPPLAERAREVMDVLSGENAAPSAALAVHALARMDRLEERCRRVYAETQPIFRKWLGSEPLVRGYESYGALFECVRLPPGLSSSAFNETLARRFDTQVVPGCFFGLDDHIRVSLAVPPVDLAEGLIRISRALRTVAQESLHARAQAHSDHDSTDVPSRLKESSPP